MRSDEVIEMFLLFKPACCKLTACNTAVPVCPHLWLCVHESLGHSIKYRSGSQRQTWRLIFGRTAVAQLEMRWIVRNTEKSVSPIVPQTALSLWHLFSGWVAMGRTIGSRHKTDPEVMSSTKVHSHYMIKWQL